MQGTPFFVRSRCAAPLFLLVLYTKKAPLWFRSCVYCFPFRHRRKKQLVSLCNLPVFGKPNVQMARGLLRSFQRLVYDFASIRGRFCSHDNLHTTNRPSCSCSPMGQFATLHQLVLFAFLRHLLTRLLFTSKATNRIFSLVP